MKPASFPILALDGGAASGKSSTAREIAARRHFLHVDTGSHYRALTAAALAAGVQPEASPKLADLLAALQFDTEIDGHEARMSINGEVPPDAFLRTAAVNQAVSQFAALPPVRDAVKRYQQSQVEEASENGFSGLVMDGRDIGTVIFPDATLKVFLFADEATRTARRQLEGLTDTIAERDRLDSKRVAAPLVPASDAVRLDNSALTLTEVVDRIEELLDHRLGTGPA